MLKSRLSIKISLRLAALAVPLMALAAWIAVLNARAAASEMILNQGRVAALAGAQAYGAILEAGVDDGTLTLKDLTEPAYVEIQFPGLVYCVTDDRAAKTPADHGTPEAPTNHRAAEPADENAGHEVRTAPPTPVVRSDADVVPQGPVAPPHRAAEPMARTAPPTPVVRSDADVALQVPAAPPHRAAEPMTPPVPAPSVPASSVPAPPVPAVKSDVATSAPAVPPHHCIENKRYFTKYGEYTDSHGIQGIQDAILGSGPFIYASGIDIRGYVATPHKKYAEPPNGDPAHDKAVSRAKRKYDEPEQLSAAGYLGNAPTLVLDYPRDTGERVWDVAAPIFVKGKHFGAFRVGVVRSLVHAQTVDLAWSLGLTLGVAILLLVGVVLISTQRALRPLVELACTATRLSTSEDGLEFEKKIRATSPDEVGQMAQSLDRMRQSFRGAWFRLRLLDDAQRLLDDALIALGLRAPMAGDSAEAARRRCAAASSMNGAGSKVS